MRGILDIRLQKLFGITIVLKVGASFFGWMLQDPWILGLAIPLALMIVYIVLGVKRHDTDVSDEKFADSCYYLGFIFTITSIIFSLFDLPNIGARIQDIAVRFGAAMISTVLGLGVRVYLISFKRDAADVTQEAEEALIDASRRFREQLQVALEKLHDFQTKVSNASTETVERVNMQVEALSRNHADSLADFFAELTNKNQGAFASALNEVNRASSRLADSVDGYSQGMRANLTSIEIKIMAFTDAITDRLKTTTFPDDYFAKQLETPLRQLTDAATAVSTSTKLTAVEVKESSTTLSAALKRLNQRSAATEESLDKVLNLTLQQQAVLDSAQSQTSLLQHLATNLEAFDSTLSRVISSINATNSTTADLTSRIGSVISEGATSRISMETSLNAILAKLGTGVAASAMIAGRLATNATASEQVAQKLDKASVAEAETTKLLGTLGQQAELVVGRVDRASTQFEQMLRQLVSLYGALRTQSEELRQVAARIKDVKVVVELSPAPANGPAETAFKVMPISSPQEPMEVQQRLDNGQTPAPQPQSMPFGRNT